MSTEHIRKCCVVRILDDKVLLKALKIMSERKFIKEIIVDNNGDSLTIPLKEFMNDVYLKQYKDKYQ